MQGACAAGRYDPHRCAAASATVPERKASHVREVRHALAAVGTWPVGAAAAAVLVRAPAPSEDAVEVVGAAGDSERVYPWASISKLCTAACVLVAVQEGTVRLADPAGPPGASVAHLLAHASGLAPNGGGVLTGPGRRRIYSNRGFEVLAAHLEERSRIPFDAYLREALLEPLAMSGAFLPQGASPATGMVGPLADLANLGRELLAPRVLASETLAMATAVAFPGLAGVLPGFGRQDPCDWGLGFELKDAKHPHWTGSRNSAGTFGHFGRSGGFLWVDPLHGAACAVLSDTSFGPWARDAWPALSDAVLAELGRS